MNAPHLSDRDIEVIRLIADGQSNREIGRRLCLAEKTIKNELTLIFVAVNVSNRYELAAYALRRGLADPGDKLTISEQIERVMVLLARLRIELDRKA